MLAIASTGLVTMIYLARGFWAVIDMAMDLIIFALNFTRSLLSLVWEFRGTPAEIMMMSASVTSSFLVKAAISRVRLFPAATCLSSSATAWVRCGFVSERESLVIYFSKSKV